MGKHCMYCPEYFRNKISPYWGCRCWIVPGCTACRDRYEKRVRDKQGELDNLKGELEHLTIELRDRKVAYQTAMSDVIYNNELELHESKLELDLQKKVSEFLKVQRRSSVEGDIMLRIHGQGIFAHQFILASKSEVLRKRFDLGKTPEDPPRVIDLDDATGTAPVIEALVNFCYNGEISFTDIAPPDEVLKSAHAYKIEHLRYVCEAELCGRINKDNSVEYLKLSRIFATRRLKEKAERIFREHFDELKDRAFEKYRISTIANVGSVTSTESSADELSGGSVELNEPGPSSITR